MLMSPLKTNSIIPMYASPSAAVITPAVPADITPPTAVPAPGMNFNKLVTTVFPNKVAPPAPIDDDNSAVITSYLHQNQILL